MDRLVSVVIPAKNEEERIAETLCSLRELPLQEQGVASFELIVVDDGSNDHTSEAARPWADRIIRNPRNYGKGRAMEIGWKAAGGGIVLFLDADLGGSAVHAGILLKPVLEGLADMTVARFPAVHSPAGFGLVKRLAGNGIYRLCGYRTTSPLSGQRAVRTEVLRRIGSLAGGFGVEVGMTIDAARCGYRIHEVQVPFTHRQTARDVRGFYHRGKQFIAVGTTLLGKWREGAK
jgi:glycosyltransferase involved in cell wall biosynthesis